MSLRKSGLAPLALAIALAGCAHAPGAAPTARQLDGLAAQAVGGELIVKFRDPAARQALLQKLGLRTTKRIERLDAVVVKAADPARALAELQASRDVAYAEPNRRIQLVLPKDDNKPQGLAGTLGVNDPLVGKQWAIAKIEAEGAWAVTRGSRDVKLAIVDTGIDYNHPDLKGRVDKGRDFINNDDDAMDDHSHGTHCAGIAAASTNNGVGIAGLAPDVSLLAVKVLSGQGYGSSEAVANGIVYAADRGSHVISLSLGDSEDSKVIQDAVTYARGKGAIVLAAMGNDSSSRPSYPAANKGVMAIGSTNNWDWKSLFSNMGNHISVTAPGSGILSCVPGGGYQSMSGTSMACPYAAGLAALVKSKFPSLNADQIKAKIEKSADDKGSGGFDGWYGHGRINARRALTE